MFALRSSRAGTRPSKLGDLGWRSTRRCARDTGLTPREYHRSCCSHSVSWRAALACLLRRGASCPMGPQGLALSQHTLTEQRVPVAPCKEYGSRGADSGLRAAETHPAALGPLSPSSPVAMVLLCAIPVLRGTPPLPAAPPPQVPAVSRVYIPSVVCWASGRSTTQMCCCSLGIRSVAQLTAFCSHRGSGSVSSP